MLANLFNASTLPVLQETAAFTETRHGILAGNLANLDTPGYRVRDLSVETFQERLKEALETRSTTSAPHQSLGITETPPDDPMRKVRDSMKNILFHDGSDVGLEQQVTEISKNQFMHNLAISLMNHQFRLLQSAISERV